MPDNLTLVFIWFNFDIRYKCFSSINGTVKNLPEIVKSVVEAAERAGVPFKVKPATLGTANDSGPFSQEGLKAITYFVIHDEYKNHEM